jgi:hypothetical protein
MPNYCNNAGFLALSFPDLLPMGFVNKKYIRQYPVGISPSSSYLSNPKPGVSYSQITDSNGNKVWLEQRIELPANQFSVYFQYMTTAKSQNTSIAGLVGEASLGLAAIGGAGFLGFAITNTQFLGGFINERS